MNNETEKTTTPPTGTIHSSFWSNIFRPANELSDLGHTLSAIPLFSFLSKKDVESMVSLVHNRNYLAGEFIFYQGDPGIGLYIIREGEVIIQRQMPNNEIISLATFSKGDFFGELALIDGEKRSASSIAKSDARLGVIFKPDLDDYIDKFPKKGVRILQGISKTIASRLRSLNEEHILSLQTLNVDEKNYGT
jgi:CRP/FNR family transcriptional regulator, cyclic AMP receptor protein